MLKRIRATIIAAIALCAGDISGASAQAVGFQRLDTHDQDAMPVELAVWYPSSSPPSLHRLGSFIQTVAPNGLIAGRNLPLVVMSNDSGGLWNHYDTAHALAAAGIVVIAASHLGDNHSSRSRTTVGLGRPEIISLAIDHLFTWWKYDAADFDRIGVFGFSTGGLAALVAVGGVPDLARITLHCDRHPTEPACRSADRLVLNKRLMATPETRHLRDDRIKAAVIAAPAMGFTLPADRLEEVTVPIQLWRADNDQVAPNPWNAEAVHHALPRLPEYHVVTNAGHFDFLAPCTEEYARASKVRCEQMSGFSRVAFHEEFNREVVAFFVRELGKEKR